MAGAQLSRVFLNRECHDGIEENTADGLPLDQLIRFVEVLMGTPLPVWNT
jgi:hypothetical protein